MSEFLNSKKFNLLLADAFSEYEEETNGKLPPDEELSAHYPLAAEELRSILKYQKRAEKTKRYGRPPAVIYLRRVAAVVLVIVSVFFCSLMLNSKVRGAVGNAIVEFFERYVHIIPSGSEQIDNATNEMSIFDFDVFSNIPKEYKALNVAENDSSREFDFTIGDKDYLHVLVCYSDGFEISVNREHSTVEEITIDGNEAFLQVDMTEEPNYVSVTVFKNNIVIFIDGYEKRDKIIGIAEAIIN